MFKKSSYSSAECVEWEYVTGGAAATVGGLVRVRDSKDRRPDKELIFTREEWEAFLAGAKAGEFDLPPALVAPASHEINFFTRDGGGSMAVHRPESTPDA